MVESRGRWITLSVLRETGKEGFECGLDEVSMTCLKMKAQDYVWYRMCWNSLYDDEWRNFFDIHYFECTRTISFHFNGSEAAVEAGNRGMRAQSLVSSSYIPETFS